MLETFQKPDGALNATAAAQMLCIVDCLYFNRHEVLEALLGPGERIEMFTFRTTTWPPSFAVISSGPADWYFVFAGTTNLRPQFLNHIQGTMGQSVPERGVYVNYQWAAVWADLKAEMGELWPPASPTARVHLAGHSYGAAIAHLAAVEMADRGRGAYVECLGLGEPRAYTVGMIGALPAWKMRLTSWQDPVAQIPAPDVVAALTGEAAPRFWPLPFATWWHYGGATWLAPGGEFAEDAPIPDPLPEGVSIGPLTEHFSRNYWGRLNAHYDREGGTPAMKAALELTKAVLDGQPVQTVTEALPRVLMAPDGEPFPVPAYDGITLADQKIGGTTGALNMPATFQHYRLAFLFNMGESGWQDIWVVKHTADDDLNAQRQVAAWASAYCDIRRACLSSTAEMVGVRIQGYSPQVGGNSVSRGTLWRKDQLPALGAGKVTGAPAQPAEAWQIVVENGPPKGLYARHYIRGLGSNMASIAVGNTRLTQPPPAQISTFAQKLRLLIKGNNPNGQNAAIGASVYLPTKARQFDLSNWITVKSFGVDANGYLKITTADLLSATLREFIVLSVDRGKCTTGIGGMYRILSVATNTDGTFTYTLNRQPCCNPAVFTAWTGRVRAAVASVQAAETVDIELLTTRDTGRAFFSRRGRRGGRCC